MEYLYWYLLFAATTALCAVYELYYPVLTSLSITKPDLMVVHSSKLMLFVLFVISVLVAPAVLLPCVVPTWGETFRLTLWNVLSKE